MAAMLGLSLKLFGPQAVEDQLFSKIYDWHLVPAQAWFPPHACNVDQPGCQEVKARPGDVAAWATDVFHALLISSAGALRSTMSTT